MIKPEGGNWVLYSHDGAQKLGEFPTEQAAMDREAEIKRAIHAKEQMTLEDRACMIREAYRQTIAATLPPGADMSTWGMEVLDDAILLRDERDGKLYKIPYTMAGDTMDAITFGDPQAVEVQLVPVSEAELEIQTPAADLTGNAWAVRIIRAGQSKSQREFPGSGGKPGPWIYTTEAIKSAPAVFEGAPVYAFEFDGSRFSHLWGISTAEKVKRGLVGNLIGYLQEVREAGGEALAKLSLLTDRATEAVKEKLLDLFRRGRQDLVGLSIDAKVLGVPVQTAEGLAFAVMQFVKPATVDVATSPAMGGAFLRALETLPEKEVVMVKELLVKLRARRPDLAAKLGESPTEVQVKEALLEALGESESPTGLTGQTGQAAGQSREAMAARLDRMEIGHCDNVLDRRLREVKLPGPAEKKIRKRFEGTRFEVAALEADITAEKEMLDALAQEGTIQGLGTPRAEVVLEQRDKLQIAMNRMFGASSKEAEAAGPKDVPAFKNFHHAFKIITGRELMDMLNHRIATAQEEILSAAWPQILGTSMHMRLLKDYAEPAYGENNIISYRPGGVQNFKTQSSERVGYFADLADVDPEAADYVEIAAPGEEEVNWAVGQKGHLLTISRKTLLNDNLGAATRMVGRLGRAARRTFARFVWNFWINNSLYDVDGTAWFTAGGGSHLNLTTDTLTADQLGASHILNGLIALANMTEPGSGERLGLPNLRDLRVWLVVPNDLLGVAHSLNSADTLPNAGNVQVPNPIYHLFGANDERIIVNALLTDATNWGLFRDPGEVDSIEVGFLNDQREPEFFVAAVPTIGQMFVADKQQYKVRHEYGGDIVDFRGAYKSINP